MREFETGSTRDKVDHKPDFEGFLSPLVLRKYAEYMHKNRQTPDGLRASDNWQAGIPQDVYMKSAWRHFMDVWTLHRGYVAQDFDGKNVELEEAICGVLFNLMGYLHEELRGPELVQHVTKPHCVPVDSLRAYSLEANGTTLSGVSG